MTSNYNLYLKSQTFPKKSPLSIIQIKRFLNIGSEYNNQDGLLEDLLNMATECAEWYTEKSFMEQEWKIACIGHIPSRVYLPFGPTIEAKEVTLEEGTPLSNHSYSSEIIGSYAHFWDIMGS